MKKNLILIIVFLALTGVGAFLFMQNKNKSDVDWQSDFGFQEIDKLSKIHLKDKKGNEMWLHKTKDGWMLNNKYKARVHFMEELLEAVEQMEAGRFVSRAAEENVLKSMMLQSTKVELYTKNSDKPEKVYHVGGPNITKNATHMLMEKDGVPAEYPYEVIIPGFRGYFTSRFLVDTVSWRDRTIFEYDTDKIQRISVQYKQQEKAINSFALFPNDGKLVDYQGQEFTDGSLNKNRVDEYVSFFQKLSCEAYYNDYSSKDSVIQHMPFCNIEVEDKKGEVTELEIFYMPPNNRTMNLIDGQYDIDRYFVYMNDRQDWAMIQDFVFGKVLIKASDLVQ